MFQDAMMISGLRHDRNCVSKWRNAFPRIIVVCLHLSLHMTIYPTTGISLNKKRYVERQRDS